tara:strand:+ start:6647 stop:7468 length:822 start_codon:yes stop_codon:yes gene_type:complete
METSMTTEFQPLIKSRNGVLGSASNNRWQASVELVDMTPAPAAPVRIKLTCEPQSVIIDLRQSAIVVIDMQNDFCAAGGWVDQMGTDPSPNRAPIAPLQGLLPELRAKGVPVIWVNWGNRPDLANMPPNQIHLYKNSGEGVGLGDPLDSNGAPVLQKDSWAAAVVDELAPDASDICVDKYRISGFWDTPLDSILRNLGVKSVLFAGVNIDQCVLHSLTDANFLGYGCVLLEDCCATLSPDFCTQATIWNVKKCFGFVTDSKRLISAMQATVSV